MFAFLSGPPDYGTGQLDTQCYREQYASKRIDADKALLPEQTPFYKDLVSDNATFHGVNQSYTEVVKRHYHMEGVLKINIVLHIIFCSLTCGVYVAVAQAANTAQSGVCVDLFVITNEYADLALLKYLSIESGGSLLLYSNAHEATLPQDLYVDFQQAFFMRRLVTG